MPTIQIVVTCSDRKKWPTPHRLRLGSVPPRKDRPRLWIDRLKNEPAARIPAIDLYAGEHWSAVKQLLTTAARSGFAPELWICSAGYGLVHSSAPLKPYGATFARGHGDSIDRQGDSICVARWWWAGLGQWKGPQDSYPRSITGLAAERPRTPMLLVASPAYLRGISDDVTGAGRILGGRLFVVSTGARSPNQLQEFVVPADTRLQHVVGGSKVGLNARVAGFLLELADGDLERKNVHSKLAAAAQGLPSLPLYHRTQLTDEQAMRLIQGSIKSNASITATAALQGIRGDGWACEQKRFGRLFRTVKENLVDS